MFVTDEDYLIRREAQERAAAAAASDAVVAAIHIELANRYAVRLATGKRIRGAGQLAA
jgi:hypothetical protein